MEIYKILEQYMRLNKLKIADVAKLCDLPDSTVRGIIKRKQKSVALEVAFKLSDGLNVSLEFLNGRPENNIKMSTSEQSHIKKYRSLNETGKKKVDDYLDDLINAGTYTDAQQHVDIEMPAPEPEPTLDELIARLDVGKVVAFGGGSKQLPPLDPKTKAEIGELLKKLEDKGE